MEKQGSASREGRFINGRKQVINLLKKMPELEKKRLLDNMMFRNSPLTKELQRESISFESIGKLPDHTLKSSLDDIGAQIIGLALKGMDPGFQKRILQLMEYNDAQMAFKTMVAPIKNTAQLRAKAQEKIISSITSYL